jgi:hypothetical protein
MQFVNSLLPDGWQDPQLARWAVWGGLTVLTLALLVLIGTRWGQKPLSKCIALSLLAHVLLAIYISTVNIVSAPPEGRRTDGVRVTLDDGEPQAKSDAHASETESSNENWDAIQGDQAPPLTAPRLAAASDPPPLSKLAEPVRNKSQVEKAAPLAQLPDLPRSEEAPPQLIAKNEPIVRPVTSRAEATEFPEEDVAEAPLVPPPERPPVVEHSDPIAGPDSAPSTDELAGSALGASAATLPKEFEGRTGNHLAGGRASGATIESEAAVKAALRWLAVNQSPNGRWDPRRLDAGIGLASDGEDRHFAGAHADTGLTGLALLAFLASGDTHLTGEYRENVRRGLEFLLASQDASGCIGATSNIYERMYCHAMGTCALSEAYAMTRDKRLLPSLQAAISFTVRTQDRASGSWRYLVGQTGDTSQLGWQVMSLKSAELGGLVLPPETRAGMAKFLGTVSSGRSGGLACYQPTRPLPTRSMTAEALACRKFLGVSTSPELVVEASNFILQEPPGVGLTNHYYWYYATLALHQTQGEPWRRWNEALQSKLLATQRHDGSWAGSWDPDPVWGRCGGRVYSTSLCTLCLEVYYRYLPLYETASIEGGPVR